MRYICEICGYETPDEEDTWPDAEESDWCCPVCGCERELFYPESED